MGISNAPAAFQTLMRLVLAGLDVQTYHAYLDDILIASPTWSQHLAHIEEILKRFKKNNLKLKARKAAVARKT